MGVKINMPQTNPQTSIGRRLFSLAAPIVGGAVGGPAGAAAGSLIGSKMAGASTPDALMSAAQAGMSAAPAKDGPAAPMSAESMNLPTLQKPQVGDSAYGRRFNAVSQNPQMAFNEGLNILSGLPQEHPLRQAYTEPLVRASYLANKGRP